MRHAERSSCSIFDSARVLGKVCLPWLLDQPVVRKLSGESIAGAFQVAPILPQTLASPREIYAVLDHGPVFRCGDGKENRVSLLAGGCLLFLARCTWLTGVGCSPAFVRGDRLGPTQGG